MPHLAVSFTFAKGKLPSVNNPPVFAQETDEDEAVDTLGMIRL